MESAGMFAMMAIGAASIVTNPGAATSATSNSVAQGARQGGYDLALGLSHHPTHRTPGLLTRFAEHTGSKTYLSLFSVESTLDYAVMGRNILTAMRDARRIHFNLDGMVGNGVNVRTLVEYGRAGIGEGNVTNWELYKVMSIPDAFQKTVFYLRGVAVDIGSL